MSEEDEDDVFAEAYDVPVGVVCSISPSPASIDVAVKTFRARVRDAVQQAELGEMDAAADAFKRALAVQSPVFTLKGSKELAAALEMAAQVEMERNKFFEAVIFAEKAVAESPSFAEGWLTLGRAQLNFGEPAMAKVSLNRALTEAEKYSGEDEGCDGGDVHLCKEVRKDLQRVEQILLSLPPQLLKNVNQLSA